jgi:hypothetical protein
MPAAAARSIGANEGRICPVGCDDDARACGKRKREQQNDWHGFKSDPHRLPPPPRQTDSEHHHRQRDHRGLHLAFAWRSSIVTRRRFYSGPGHKDHPVSSR